MVRNLKLNNPALLKPDLNLIVKTHFDAAHYLNNYNGECSHLHGHRWNIDVYIKTNPGETIEYDFKDIKKLINNALPDHRCLNKLYDFNPTAENLAVHLKHELCKDLPVTKLIIWETPECGVQY